jgi:hypothetical protein
MAPETAKHQGAEGKFFRHFTLKSSKSLFLERFNIFILIKLVL